MRKIKIHIALLCALTILLGHTPSTVVEGLADTLVCNQVEHIHSDGCFSISPGDTLICTASEEPHHHVAGVCFEEIQTYICGYEEHTEVTNIFTSGEVFAPDNTFSGNEDIFGRHIHSEDCVVTETVWKCTLEEGVTHLHSAECYQKVMSLVCEYEAHKHTEECYQRGTDNPTDIFVSQSTDNEGQTFDTAIPNEGPDDFDTAVIGESQVSVEDDIKDMSIYSSTGKYDDVFCGNPNSRGIANLTGDISLVLQYFTNKEMYHLCELGSACPLYKTWDSGKSNNKIQILDTRGGHADADRGTREVSAFINTDTNKLYSYSTYIRVFADTTFSIQDYNDTGDLLHLNAGILNSDDSQRLSEIWIGKPQWYWSEMINSTDEQYFNIYNYGVNFSPEYIIIDENSNDIIYNPTYILFDTKSNRYISARVLIVPNQTIVRFIYEYSEEEADLEVDFYDYDVSDGYIYLDRNEAAQGVNRHSTSEQIILDNQQKTMYANTWLKGIHSPANYSDTTNRFGFGNSKLYSGVQDDKWDGRWLNRANGYSATFGLAECVSDGKLVFNKGFTVPELFGDTPAIGKTVYNSNEFSLRFRCLSNQYTLSSVIKYNNGAYENIQDNLDVFSSMPRWRGGILWYNTFFPMDYAPSYGSDGHDLKYGVKTSTRACVKEWISSTGEVLGSDGRFLASDDGKDHNFNFGMNFKLKFTLDVNYVAPLQWMFFGDDDLWVFLGSEDDPENAKLVGDVGGVHSAVGTYINLWDYINLEEEHMHTHTDECYTLYGDLICGYMDSKDFYLHIYYLERGNSGSTCWMSFDLPQVETLTHGEIIPETNWVTEYPETGGEGTLSYHFFGAVLIVLVPLAYVLPKIYINHRKYR